LGSEFQFVGRLLLSLKLLLALSLQVTVHSRARQSNIVLRMLCCIAWLICVPPADPGSMFVLQGLARQNHGGSFCDVGMLGCTLSKVGRQAITCKWPPGLWYWCVRMRFVIGRVTGDCAHEAGIALMIALDVAARFPEFRRCRGQSRECVVDVVASAFFEV
jgi:hypothetical protein